MEEDWQDHEEEDDDRESQTVEFHNNELGEPAKIATPPPTVLNLWGSLWRGMWSTLN